jgi:L-alanine-DL-glutamate epimerase-like enolase superfamily enzyme
MSLGRGLHLFSIWWTRCASARGLTGTLQVLDYCFAHHVLVCPDTGFSGGINKLVSMHVAATAHESGILEHMIIDNPLREILTEPLPEPELGVVRVPRGEAFGRNIDSDKLHELAIDIQHAAR